jgi:hypothetical protein
MAKIAVALVMWTAAIPMFDIPAHAHNVAEAILAGTPLIDLRLRYENILQSSKANAAEATTLRARLGYQTASYAGFQLLGEADIVQHFGPEDYNDTLNGRTVYPIIADPDMVALNRLQLGYATHLFTDDPNPPDLTLAAGRQRIVYGDSRFIGNAGWRQHEQTYDGISLSDSSLPQTVFSYAYIVQVNRVFGPRSPNATFDSNSHLFNALYSGIPHTRLEGYVYLLDLKNAPRLSSATYGARAENAWALGAEFAANANGAIARQENYAQNPARFGLDYYLAEGGVAYGNFSALAGYEVLQGNGVVAFQTPLASLHLFQGWAENFLTDPASGIRDSYVKASYNLPSPPLFARLTGTIVYHDFSAEHVHAGYGNEWDAMLEASIISGVVFDIAYADYRGGGPFPSKQGLWLYTTYRY